MINIKKLMAVYAAGIAAAGAGCHDVQRNQGIHFSDKSISLFREPHREMREFSIKGHKIMAYSRKDAITRLKHQKKNQI